MTNTQKKINKLGKLIKKVGTHMRDTESWQAEIKGAKLKAVYKLSDGGGGRWGVSVLEAARESGTPTWYSHKETDLPLERVSYWSDCSAVFRVSNSFTVCLFDIDEVETGII
jgi:hypothetical protein